MASTAMASAIAAAMQNGVTAQKVQCFKTKRCWFYDQGRCSRGAKCTYAHYDDELRPTPKLQKTKICSRWKKGQCPLAQHECKYAHGEDDLMSTPPVKALPESVAASMAQSLAEPGQKKHDRKSRRANNKSSRRSKAAAASKQPAKETSISDLTETTDAGLSDYEAVAEDDGCSTSTGGPTTSADDASSGGDVTMTDCDYPQFCFVNVPPMLGLTAFYWTLSSRSWSESDLFLPERYDD